MNNQNHMDESVVHHMNPDPEWSNKVTNGEYKLEKSEKNKFNPLTGDEKKWIACMLTCPDCLTGGLVAGPRGGMSINFTCDNAECGSRFNLTATNTGKGMSLLFAERI